MRFLKRLWALAHEHIEQGLAPTLDVAALSDAGKNLRRKPIRLWQKLTMIMGGVCNSTRWFRR